VPTTCVEVTVDFDLSAANKPLPGGFYVCDEWEDYGLTLSTKGGLAGERCPRLFNTSDADNSNDPTSVLLITSAARLAPVLEQKADRLELDRTVILWAMFLSYRMEILKSQSLTTMLMAGRFSSILMARLSTLVTLGFWTWITKL
jgi:hypothetical protein